MTLFLGIGLEVTFVEDDDGHRYATGERDRTDLRWRRANERDSPAEPASIVAVGPSQGVVRRTVIHPAPKRSALWGTVRVDDALVLYRDESPIGTAKVAWVHDLDQGIQQEDLRAMVTWSAVAGSQPSR